ncbi:MAG: hypothetical protein HZC45_01145 [Deltaproteobacteria bacterium]|nr:hypothetical protein [Deltaproteobacteria bacterium]
MTENRLNKNVTRGYGLLGKLLAHQRSNLANRLIPPSTRNGRILDIGCGFYPLFLLSTEFSEKYGFDKVKNMNDYKSFNDNNNYFY